MKTNTDTPQIVDSAIVHGISLIDTLDSRGLTVNHDVKTIGSYSSLDVDGSLLDCTEGNTIERNDTIFKVW